MRTVHYLSLSAGFVLLLAAGLLAQPLDAPPPMPPGPPPLLDNPPEPFAPPMLLCQGPGGPGGGPGFGPGRHGPGMGRGPGMQDPEKLDAMVTPEMEARVMDFLKKESPQRAKKLEDLKARNPIQYNRWVLRANERMMRLEEVQEKDPEAYKEMKAVFKAEDEVEMLAEKARESKSDTDMATLKAKLNELFDLRETGRQREVKMLEKRMVELKKSLESRKANKATIVDRHVKEMMGEKDDLDW